MGLHARGLPATPRPLAQRMLRRGAPRTRGRGPHDDDLRRPRVLGCGHRRAGVEGKGRREADDGCRPRTPPSDRSPDRSSERVPQRHPVLRAPRISSRVRGHPLAWPSPRKTEGSDRPTDSRGRSSRPCGDRLALLARLATEFPFTFLVAERGGRPKGFIVGNPSGDACEIGPWVVEPMATGVAQNLFHALVEAAGSSELALSGPSQNRALLEFVHEAGFVEVFRALRMWWGTNAFPGDPTGIWAAGGLEKG